MILKVLPNKQEKTNGTWEPIQFPLQWCGPTPLLQGKTNGFSGKVKQQNENCITQSIQGNVGTFMQSQWLLSEPPEWIHFNTRDVKISQSAYQHGREEKRAQCYQIFSNSDIFLRERRKKKISRIYNPYGLQNWPANRYKNRYLADEHSLFFSSLYMQQET